MNRCAPVCDRVVARIVAIAALVAPSGGCAATGSGAAHAPTVTVAPASPPEPPTARPATPASHRYAGTHASVRVLDVRRDDAGAGTELSLAATLAFGRPDLAQEEPDNTSAHRLTADLPPSLQVKLAYVSRSDDPDPQGGVLCDVPRFPHDCGLPTPTPAETGDNAMRLLARITFLDGTHETVPFELPMPPPVRSPDVLEPSATPAQGASFAIAFRDVGADAYGITVRQCEPYPNDGINPCLDSFHIDLTRRGQAIDVVPSFDEPRPEAALGEERILVRASRPLRFTESLEIEVTAERRSLINGTRTLARTTARRSFER